MKKIFILTALAAAAMSLAACKADQIEPEAPETTLSIEKSELIIPAKGGEAFLVVKSESAFKAAAEKDWCNITIDKDTVRIAAAANETLDSRYSKVTLTNDEESTSVMIQQFGFKTSTFGPADITCSSDSVAYDFPYEYDEVLEASVNQDWITLTITENNLNVKIAENTVKATADNRSRKAEISWKLGIDAGTINVEQLNVDFMQPDANWTVAYEGYKVYEGDGNKYEHISNTVADPKISGMYYFTYFTKDEYTASKLKMGDFIATLVPALKAEADDIIDYYKSVGYDLTYEDLLYEDSDYEIFDKFDDGDYYACVIGFDKTFTPTGHYAVAEFTKENAGGATGYAAWLGDWKCPHGTSTTKFDTWTFTEKEKGLTYWVTGIEGYTDLKIVAEYDEATEGIIVRAQSDLAKKTIGGAEYSVGFFGATNAGNFWIPNDPNNAYKIFSATIDGDTAQLAPISINTEDGYVDPDIAVYIGVDASGTSATLLKKFSDATLTNVVLTKEGGSSDDPGTGGGSGSEQYNKWLGTWTAPNDQDETFDFTVSTKEADKTFNLRGWEMDEAFFEDWEAPFDATKGSLALHVNTNVPIATNVDVGKTDPYNFYYYGTIIYTDGEEYVISGDYDAALGTIGSDGKGTFVGQSITLQGESGSFEIKNFVLCGVNVNNANNIISWKGESTGFPLTVTKASGSKSIKSFGGNRWNLSLENAVKIDPSHVLKVKEPELVEMTAFVAKSEPARTPKFIVK